jgi:murein DD-endopeptidase MepM/ murein hydrolase activator NlpD
VLAVTLALGGCVQSASLPRGPTPQDPPPLPPRRPAPPPNFAAQAGAPLPITAGLYRVSPGDTVYAIANRAGLPLRAVIDANRLQPPYTLVPGSDLIIPRARVHVVKAGETVYGISRMHDVDMSELTRLNGVGPPFEIRVGQRLVLPDPGTMRLAAVPPASESAAVSPAAPTPSDPPVEPPASAPAPEASVPEATVSEPPVPDPAPARTPSPDRSETAAAADGPPVPPRRPERQIETAAVAPTQPSVEPAPEPIAPSAIPQPPGRAGDAFAWPVRGRILARYGPQDGGRHNDGINIAAPRGAPFLAAENGVVAYVGSELKGYGQLVLVKHADGWVTAYAHADTVAVRLGETVRRGQAIGRIGETGAVDQPQLHFEIRKGTNAVDPLQMLENAS